MSSIVNLKLREEYWIAWRLKYTIVNVIWDDRD